MYSRLIANVLDQTARSVLLLGPRQTGKSTLIASLKPDLEINLAHEPTYLEFSSNPSALENRLAAQAGTRIFIDEVQRIPSLLNTIQVLLDLAKRGKRPPVKFFLTGSSARKLKHGQANLLTGRLFAFDLGPLVAAEMDYQLDVGRALEIGCLPEPYSETNVIAQSILKNYAATYLREEIQAELFVRNLEGFSRFLQVAAERSGQFLDFSKIAKAARVPRQSTIRYFDVLEDTLIARRVETFRAAAGADVVKHPRYFFFDTGVLNGLLGNFTASPDRKGFLFEHLVFNQIYYSARARDAQISIHNFRTRHGSEVDFVVEYGGVVWAIEAKATDGPVQSDAFKGLRSFSSYYKKPHQKIVVVPQGVDQKVDDIWVLSLTSLLKKMGL